MSNIIQPINQNNIFTRVKLILQSLFWAFDWGWNPTHTNSALKAVESFMNQKNSYPNLQAMLDSNPEQKIVFSSSQFIEDISNNWDFDQLQKEYSQGSLGYEYVDFMNQLGFKPLNMNFSDNIPSSISSILKLGIRNHDIIHLLLGLYQSRDDGKLDITDYHEWIFLSWTVNMVKDSSDRGIVNLLLFPSRIKALLTFDYSRYNQAMRIGSQLARTSVDLNLTWLTPYFDKPIELVRQELGIITMNEVLQ